MKTNNRRTFLKQSALLAGAATVLPSASFSIMTKNNKNGKIVGHGDFTYRVNKDWVRAKPKKVPVKDCHEMVEDKKGRLIMTTTDTNNNIVIFNKSGKVLKTWGTEFPGAHGLTLSNEGGEEFLFITDHDRHQVFKTTLDGKIVLTLDYPKETGLYKEAATFKPTETAVAPNGDIYVADGYGQNYIMQYNHKGELLRHFGGKGEREDQFDCCHGILVDTRTPDNPVLLITSRAQNELKRFTLDGKYMDTIPFHGHSICRPVIKNDLLHFAVIVTKTWDTYDGMLFVVDKDYKVLSAPGGSAPEYDENGVLQAVAYDGETFFNPHDVCVDGDGNLYVPQWNSKNTYPLMLERV